jgi:hypothetical protein
LKEKSFLRFNEKEDLSEIINKEESWNNRDILRDEVLLVKKTVFRNGRTILFRADITEERQLNKIIKN